MTTIPNVPWMIEGGAKHTVQVARNLAFMAAGGTEGIVLGRHLEVRELAVPGTSVRVFPGTFAVLNRAAGAADEIYVDSFASELEVPIAATGASARSDLIVARIENPWASGETWPDPADATVGPYASLAVISGVPASTTSVDDLGLSADHTMIALARIDVPASTGTITQSMIVDLREMANAVTKRELEVFTGVTVAAQSSATFEAWPPGAEAFLDIPDWATHARVVVTLSGVQLGGAGTNGGAGWNAVGELRVRIGGAGGDFYSPVTKYDVDSESGKVRVTLLAAGKKIALPDADRGRKGVNFRVEGRKTSGNDNLRSDGGTTAVIDVEFVNEPESNL